MIAAWEAGHLLRRGEGGADGADDGRRAGINQIRYTTTDLNCSEAAASSQPTSWCPPRPPTRPSAPATRQGGSNWSRVFGAFPKAAGCRLCLPPNSQWNHPRKDRVCREHVSSYTARFLHFENAWRAGYALRRQIRMPSRKTKKDKRRR